MERILEGAFQGCNGLEEVLVPATVERIEKLAFADCENLKKIILENASGTKVYSGATKGSPNAELTNLSEQ